MHMLTLQQKYLVQSLSWNSGTTYQMTLQSTEGPGTPKKQSCCLKCPGASSWLKTPVGCKHQVFEKLSKSVHFYIYSLFMRRLKPFKVTHWGDLMVQVRFLQCSFQKCIEIGNSVTRWLNQFSIFGRIIEHLTSSIKLPKQVQKFAKYQIKTIPKFSLSLLKLCQSGDILPIWSHWCCTKVPVALTHFPSGVSFLDAQPMSPLPESSSQGENVAMVHTAPF